MCQRYRLRCFVTPIVEWILQKCTHGRSVSGKRRRLAELNVDKNVGAVDVDAMSHGVLLKISINSSMRTYSCRWSKFNDFFDHFLIILIFVFLPAKMLCSLLHQYASPSRFDWRTEDVINRTIFQCWAQNYEETRNVSHVIQKHIFQFISKWEFQQSLHQKAIQSNCVSYNILVLY